MIGMGLLCRPSRTGLPAVCFCLGLLWLFVGTGRASEPRHLHSIALIDIRPQRQTDAYPLLAAYARDTRREPGCLDVQFLQEQAPLANHFAFVATWQDAESRRVHLDGQIAHAFREALQPMLASPVDDRVYEAADPAPQPSR